MAEIGDFSQEMTAWFDFGEDGVIEMAFLPKDGFNRILKKHTRTTFKRGQQVEKTDDDKANIELGRKVVRNWRGLTKKGLEFPYTPENCDLLMRKSYAFSNFVTERCVEIEEFAAERDEAAIKKSEPMPSGGQSK